MKVKFFTLLFLTFFVWSAHGQHEFPACWEAWSAGTTYTGGDQVSFNKGNYQAKWFTTAQPGTDGSWTMVSKCGDGGLGENYTGPQRIIGYLPTWIPDYDLANFEPSVVTHINIAFMMFQQNNNNYGSADFASIAFNAFEKEKVDSVLFDLKVLEKAHQKGVTVSAALGGATDFGFVWLMEKYYNNDAKLEEIATLITNYVNTTGLDGIDLDLECWWADPTIAGTTEKGGLVRGDKWGTPDPGAHPAGIGLTRLAQKLRQKMPDKLISAAVFGTSWYGNNYDDGMVEYLDWLGLMTYDFTGSWDESPIGPHSSLYKVASGYQGQSADNPIYSAVDALEYWMGLAEPAWNHDGGFDVPKAKLVIGVPMYGYDLSQRKPDNGNGFLFVPYRNIIADYPNAATSYDPLDARKMGGFIGQEGKKLYYETPKRAAEKINYTKANGHQGVIIWELTQDVPYTHEASLLKALNDAAGRSPDANQPPVVSITSPSNNATFASGASITIEANATDGDGTISKVEFFNGSTKLGEDTSSPYTYTWTGAADGNYSLTAKATDDKNAVATSTAVNISIGEPTENTPPTVSITAPANGAEFEEGETITITASANDSDGSIAKVDFFNDGTKLGESSTAPYTFVLSNATAGAYSFTATATDDQGASTTSAAVAIGVTSTSNPGGCDAAQYVENGGYAAGSQVQNEGNVYTCKDYPYSGWCNGAAWAYAPGAGANWQDAWTLTGECTGGDENQAPSASITSPSNNATFEVGQTITITANASDSDGNIAKVEFLVNETVVGESVTSPYTYAWENATAGSHNLTVRATDNEGASTTSSAIAVVINGDSNGTPPTVSITSPTNSDTFLLGETVTISANASDADGTVTLVEFLVNDTVVGTGDTAPYTVNWSALIAGSNDIAARATDNEGNTTTSATVTILVNVDGGNCSVEAWNPSAIYTGGNQISYEGNIYQANWWSQGDNPAQNSGQWAVWTLIGPCGAAANAANFSETTQATVEPTKVIGTQEHIMVYPNPSAAGSLINLSFGMHVKEAKVLIQNLNGNMVFKNTYQEINGHLTIELPSIPVGMYIIKVTAGANSWTEKHMIK